MDLFLDLAQFFLYNKSMRKLAPFFLKLILLVVLYQALSLGYYLYSQEIMTLPKVPNQVFFLASLFAIISYSFLKRVWFYFFRPLITFLIIVPLINKGISEAFLYFGWEIPALVKTNIYYSSFALATYLSTLGFFLIKKTGSFLFSLVFIKPVKLFYYGMDEIFIFFENLFYNPPENIKNFMIDIDQIQGSSDYDRGRQFEEIVAEAYCRLGYEAKTTGQLRSEGLLPESIQKRGGSGEQGVDVLVRIPLPRGHFSGQKEKIMAVQCKLYKGKVDNKAVQEIVAALPLYGADFGVVITNNYFTQPAKELAEANGVELVNRIKLQKLLEKSYQKIAA